MTSESTPINNSVDSIHLLTTRTDPALGLKTRNIKSNNILDNNQTTFTSVRPAEENTLIGLFFDKNYLIDRVEVIFSTDSDKAFNGYRHGWPINSK